MSESRTSLVYYVSETIRELNIKAVTMVQLIESSGAEKGSLSRYMWMVAEEGYLKKVKSGNTNYYSLTPKGRALIKENKNEIMGRDDFIAWTVAQKKGNGTGKPRTKKQEIPARYSEGAVQAIESIASLVDENEKLKILLISIVKQCQSVLEPEKEAIDERD